MKRYMRRTYVIAFFVIGLSASDFSNFAFCDEQVDSGLSIANVYSTYRVKDKSLQIIFVLLNKSNDNITVLTDHLNTEYLKDSNTYVIGVGSMTVKYKGYSIIESLYNYAPVTLRPKEGTGVNHIMKTTFKDIDQSSEFKVKYEIREEFGKRFNVWSGSVESSLINPKIIK